MTAEPAVKCVVWDLDNTVWDGVAVESLEGSPPRPFPGVLDALSTLEARGVVNSVASRTDPAVAALLERGPLAGRFLVPQLGWGDKSGSLRRIAAELGIGLSAMAFVDDDAFERGEVAALLPEVLVLAPEELFERLDTARLGAGPATADARVRVGRYRDEQVRRREREAFTGTREEFLRHCRMRLTVGPAAAADADRVAELAARTHRLNSTGDAPSARRVAQLIEDPGWLVASARLADRYGEYGLIGAALVRRDGVPEPGAWYLHLMSVSCRVAGRGVAAAFLGWLMATARDARAERFLAGLRRTEANVELRLLFRGCGLRPEPAGPAAPAGEPATRPGSAGAPVPGLNGAAVPGPNGAPVALLGRSLAEPLPAPPPWLYLSETAGA